MPGRRPPSLSLDLLRGFRAAARHLSFTRAAQELFITQSAISHEVKALEQQLGTPLFLRANRTLQLTDAGRELLHAVDEALSLVDAAAARISGTTKAFTVTTTVPMASLWLGPRLARFTRQHPDRSMRVVASNDVLDIEREGIDVAIRYLRRGAESAGSEKLCDYEIFPVCTPALARDRARGIRTVSDLSRHLLLDMETATNGRPWYDWKLWFEAMGIRDFRAAGSLRFSHYDQVVDAAREGSGVAIGKRPHLARHLKDGELVAPLGEASVAIPGGLYAVVSKDAPADIAAAFIQWLHSEVRRDAAARPAAKKVPPVRPRAAGRQ
ncbi:MAG TPA: LysR substrate-binding domain-containing protein [Burkholderiaceae bacterium]|nr:LysR substrate-binding domain-containing protein [Burkholderiaceae bacterium]